MTKVIVDAQAARAIGKGAMIVFKKGVVRVEGEIRPGDIVEVYTRGGKFLGKGFANPNSNIMVRIVTKDKDVEINKELFRERIRKANEYRKKVLRYGNVYRMVYGEADYLPGLIVDRFNDIASLQISSAGMERFKMDVAEAIMEIEPGIETVFEKNTGRSRRREGLPEIERVLLGKEKYRTVIEEGRAKFIVDMRGQKTGFFLDQRENRLALEKWVRPGDRILDVFTYTGGFAIHAAIAGADEVIAIDKSPRAIETAKENAKLNGVEDRIKFIVGSAFEEMEKLMKRGEKFDIVILDPPAFVQHEKDLKAGLRAYFNVNFAGLNLVKDGGILVTCSCSQHVDLQAFKDMIIAAAAKAGKFLKMLEPYRTQAPDHPILMASKDTEYLKCLFLYVEDMR
ncbi:class I SAM-dependent rRNA methyltransferase [Pyrococcus yayanosii]|uniref:Ribosomal protein L11 methyltransferase, putative n=1 Tax=Pyrococcus yayanosii (strain CH1 / JCM 16557) TaxID=529709 RepID=F8AFN3_PYRYC|nr:class I SAM-dependent rRNA methyltransferase [Pyrococcus yayanosii]AEH25000.1 ribosomal protein L11 methyltransferase, putative [Pyrococcus yayanosii CH1]